MSCVKRAHSTKNGSELFAAPSDLRTLSVSILCLLSDSKNLGCLPTPHSRAVAGALSIWEKLNQHHGAHQTVWQSSKV